MIHIHCTLLMMRLFGYDVICPFYFQNENGGGADDRKRLHIICN